MSLTISVKSSDIPSTAMLLDMFERAGLSKSESATGRPALRGRAEQVRRRLEDRLNGRRPCRGAVFMPPTVSAGLEEHPLQEAEATDEALADLLAEGSPRKNASIKRTHRREIRRRRCQEQENVSTQSAEVDLQKRSKLPTPRSVSLRQPLRPKPIIQYDRAKTLPPLSQFGKLATPEIKWARLWYVAGHILRARQVSSLTAVVQAWSLWAQASLDLRAARCFYGRVLRAWSWHVARERAARMRGHEARSLRGRVHRRMLMRTLKTWAEESAKHRDLRGGSRAGHLRADATEWQPGSLESFRRMQQQQRQRQLDDEGNFGLDDPFEPPSVEYAEYPSALAMHVLQQIQENEESTSAATCTRSFAHSWKQATPASTHTSSEAMLLQAEAYAIYWQRSYPMLQAEAWWDDSMY